MQYCKLFQSFSLSVPCGWLADSLTLAILIENDIAYEIKPGLNNHL